MKKTKTVTVKEYEFNEGGVKVVKVNGSSNQQEVHGFAREGLESLSPVKAAATRDCRHGLESDMRKALHYIERQLEVGQWLGPMEVYSNGFNVWVRYMGTPDSVFLYTYRRDGKNG